MTIRRIPGPALVALIAGFLLPVFLAPSARAEFGPIKLISKSPYEQAEFADETAVSADGRYVAFCAGIGGKAGIFREELASGHLDPVSVVAAKPNPLFSKGCSSSLPQGPSISADGRYVSFTTTASLVPEDEEANSSDVYVADMATSPPTYQLVSVGESGEPLEGGSRAAGRVALSADGGRVAFVNQGNVYVREVAAKKTILISAKRNQATGLMEEDEEPTAKGRAYEPAAASISADGSTVAWVGERLPEQVPVLSEEETLIQGTEESGGHYFEPLWRRVPEPGAPLPLTRRIVGGGDPLAPGCPAWGTLETPACQGPYPNIAKGYEWTLLKEPGWTGFGTVVPMLSADGDRVALTGFPEEQADLFVVDMDPGLDRKEAVRPLTKWVNPQPGNNNPNEIFEEPEFLPYTGAIGSFAISADGDRIAFCTVRQHFALVSPTLVSPLPAAVDTVAEVYQVDLGAETIQRLTPGPGAGVSLGAGAASSPSYSADGTVLAFSSGAYNLVEGDANESTDAFVVESPFSPPAGKSAISAPPASLVLHPTWRLSARAVSQPNGTVKVVAVVPGKGTARARAKARLGLKLTTHRVASATHRSSSSGVVRLRLRLRRHLRPQARKKGGLASTIAVTFTGSGGKPLHAMLDAHFKVFKKKAHKGGKSKKDDGR